MRVSFGPSILREEFSAAGNVGMGTILETSAGISQGLSRRFLMEV